MRARENMAMKALAFIAAVAAFTATAIMGWYQLVNFDALWSESLDYAEGSGYTRTYLVRMDYYVVRNMIALKERQAAGLELSLAEKRSLERLEAEYDAGATNLRWQLLDKDGGVIYGNTQEDSAQVDTDYWVEYGRERFSVDTGWRDWDAVWTMGAANLDQFTGECYSDAWRYQLSGLVEQARSSGEEAPSSYISLDPDGGGYVEVTADTVLSDLDGMTKVLQVTDTLTGDIYVYPPTVNACLAPNQFGYIFDPVSLTWEQTEGAAQRETASLVLWVDDALRVDDQYRRAALKLEEWQASRAEHLAVTIVCGVAGMLLMVYLCCGAGHKRGVEGIYLNWFHRIPGDVLLFLLFLGGVGALGIGVTLALDAYMDAPMFIQLICIGTAVAAAAALGMGALITVCARCKAHTLLRNTWTWAVCAWCWRVSLLCVGKLWELFGAAGRAVRAVPLIWKAVLGCMMYVLFTISTFQRGAGLWLLVTLAASAYLCGWAYQWKKIRRGTQVIIGGDPSYHIDTRGMLPDLKSHADELNDLGLAISAAVEDRIQSERFKAELITNVSHDLKTPLTSIINYVDLLKKADIQDPKALEYIEVLDRKSQRLKKLTEDLVEASKASTGNLTVNWERLDWAQLTDQALAECGDRLEGQQLTVVRSLPGEPLWVEADGRHLWRVLDNLLTNCAKYALPGTRVYVDLRRSGDWAVLSVKNISRDALDIPAERLMERFVRGDESRNQAGSGLGLSIAQSLTELQHGKFEIGIDGDLFKAIVTLPLAGGRPAGPLPGGRPDDPIQLVL